MKHPPADPASPLDQATWQQILAVAEARFLAKGYKGVSMREIADAVQVVPSALYHHFPKGKEDLFIRMIQALFARGVAADQDQPLLTKEQVRERLTRLTTDLLTLPLDQLPLLLRDAREHLKDPANQRMVASLHDQVKQQVLRLFQAAQAAGVLRTDLPVAVLVLAYLGTLKEAKGSARPPDAAQLVSVLLDGMAGSAPRTHP